MIDICLCVCVCWTYLSINFSIFFSVFLLARSVHLTLFHSSSFKLFKTENILCFVLFLCTAARRIRCTNDTNERRRQREVIVYLRYFHSKSSISPLDRSPVFTFATLWHSNWRMTVHSDGHIQFVDGPQQCTWQTQTRYWFKLQLVLFDFSVVFHLKLQLQCRSNSPQQPQLQHGDRRIVTVCNRWSTRYTAYLFCQ